MPNPNCQNLVILCFFIGPKFGWWDQSKSKWIDGLWGEIGGTSVLKIKQTCLCICVHSIASDWKD